MVDYGPFMVYFSFDRASCSVRLQEGTRLDYKDMSDEELLVLLISRLPDIGITEVDDSNRETVIAILTVNEKTTEGRQ